MSGSDDTGNGPRRTALAVALTAVMVGSVLTAGVAFVGPASAASETISSCQTIDESGHYVLGSDLSASGSDCLDVTASDVTIDGNGHTIAGDGGATRSFGVHVDGTSGSVSNVTVTDVTLTDWKIGLHAREVAGLTVSNVNSVENDIYGYWFVGSSDVHVEDSVARGHHTNSYEGLGFSTLGSHDMTFVNVTAAGNDIGMHFDNGAHDVRVVDSTIRGSEWYSYWTQAYRGSGPANFTADHLTIEGVTLSFTAQNALIGMSDSPAVPVSAAPALPSGLESVAGNIVASRTPGPGSSLDFTFHYGGASGVDESTVGTWVASSDGGSWTQADGSSVDPAANTASGSIVFSSGTDVFLTAAGQPATGEPEPEPEPANFSVSGLSAPSTVTRGDTVSVSANVTNTGGSEATQTVEFRADLNGDGTPEAIGLNESVTLAAGASQTVSFDVPTGDVPPGTYAHGVFTANDSATAQLTVEAPEPEPTASVAFANQSTNGTTVTVDSVTMSEGGFVAIHNSSLFEGNALGSVVGVSEYLSAGTHENVTVTLFDVPGANYGDDMSLEANETLIAMPHLDTNGNGAYNFVASGGSADGAYTDGSGAVVDSATVTVEDDEPMEPETTYYQVDFVAGEPIENLSADRLYADADENRLVRFAHGNTSAGITDRGRAWASQEVRSCVDRAGVVERDGDTATVTFTVNETCSNVTMSLVSYTKPGAGFSPETADQQELFDATTRTFGPGEHTIEVALPDGDDANATDLTAAPVAPPA